MNARSRVFAATWRVIAAGWVVAVTVNACGGDTNARGGSETNFQHCTTDAECGTGQRCEQGMCAPHVGLDAGGTHQDAQIAETAAEGSGGDIADGPRIVDASPERVTAMPPDGPAALEWTQMSVKTCYNDAGDPDGACSTWTLASSGILSASGGPTRLTTADLESVEAATRDPAFVDGVENGFPDPGVSDAWATLTVDTVTGTEWVQDVSGYVLFPDLFPSSLGLIETIVERTLYAKCLTQDRATFCCCDAPGGQTVVAPVCDATGWSCPAGGESGACDDATFCMSINTDG